MATTGSYDDLSGVPTILQELEYESDRLPTTTDIRNWNAAHTHSASAHFDGDYADLNGKPVLLQEDNVANIAEGRYNQNVNGVDINASTEVTVTAATIETIFKHATQAAHDALPVGTVIMWSNAKGGNISDYVGTGKSWEVLAEMQGRFPVAAAFGPGENNGLEKYAVQETGGKEQVTLEKKHLPDHTHTVKSTIKSVADGGWGTGDNTRWLLSTDMETESVTPNSAEEGVEKPHENRPPFYALLFLIKVK